eukprot:scaffold62311_cov57-Phaeocystis_antarctica.AAC.1
MFYILLNVELDLEWNVDTALRFICRAGVTLALGPPEPEHRSRAADWTPDSTCHLKAARLQLGAAVRLEAGLEEAHVGDGGEEVHLPTLGALGDRLRAVRLLAGPDVPLGLGRLGLLEVDEDGEALRREEVVIDELVVGPTVLAADDDVLARGGEVGPDERELCLVKGEAQRRRLEDEEGAEECEQRAGHECGHLVLERRARHAEDAAQREGAQRQVEGRRSHLHECQQARGVLDERLWRRSAKGGSSTHRAARRGGDEAVGRRGTGGQAHQDKSVQGHGACA